MFPVGSYEEKNLTLRRLASSQVQLAWLQKALELEGEDAGYAEVECAVANLIYRRYIKGYISHAHRVLVLSKTDPFPPLEQAQVAD